MLHNVDTTPTQMSSADQQQLEKLQQVIAAAIADGRIDTEEIEQIRAAIFADGKVTPEEIEMYRQQVLEKLQSGELEMDN